MRRPTCTLYKERQTGRQVRNTEYDRMVKAREQLLNHPFHSCSFVFTGYRYILSPEDPQGLSRRCFCFMLCSDMQFSGISLDLVISFLIYNSIYPMHFCFMSAVAWQSRTLRWWTSTSPRWGGRRELTGAVRAADPIQYQNILDNILMYFLFIHRVFSCPVLVTCLSLISKFNTKKHYEIYLVACILQNVLFFWRA